MDDWMIRSGVRYFRVRLRRSASSGTTNATRSPSESRSLGTQPMVTAVVAPGISVITALVQQSKMEIPE